MLDGFNALKFIFIGSNHFIVSTPLKKGISFSFAHLHNVSPSNTVYNLDIPKFRKKSGIFSSGKKSKFFRNIPK